MDVLYERIAAPDIGSKSVTALVRTLGPRACRVGDTRMFPTMSRSVGGDCPTGLASRAGLSGRGQQRPAADPREALREVAPPTTLRKLVPGKRD